MRNMWRSPLFVAVTLVVQESVRGSLGVSAALNSARHAFDAERRSQRMMERQEQIVSSIACPPEA